MTPELDAAAVRRVLDGHDEAFEGIVERWQGPLVNLAFRFCRNAAWAEELAQEAFVRAYRSLGRWRGDAAFSTWLIALATNVCRSGLRRKRLPSVPLDALSDVADWRTEEGDLERRERETFVREAVKALPPKYRDAVVLYYFHEMSLEQAASSLGLPQGTVKSQLFRARKLLEKHLGSLLGSPGESEEEAA